MQSESIKKLAEDHADWLFELLRKVYVEAMEHGYKHGWEDAKAELFRNPKELEVDDV